MGGTRAALHRSPRSTRRDSPRRSVSPRRNACAVLCLPPRLLAVRVTWITRRRTLHFGMAISRRDFLLRGALAGAATLAAGTGLYAWQVEPHWFEVVRRPMPLEHL